MSTAVSRTRISLPVVTGALAAGALVVAAVVAVHVARRPGRSHGGDEIVTLAVTLPPGAAGVHEVGYLVTSSSNEPLSSGLIHVTDSKAPLSAEVAVPVGAGRKVTFIAEPSANDGRGLAFLGSKTFDVVAGGDNRVALAGPEVNASVGIGGQASAGSDTTSGAGSLGSGGDCQSCELAAGTARCDPELLTAIWNTDPRGRDQVSWGCATLSTEPQKAACSALLHCLTSNSCAEADRPPVNGCYCGNATAVACFVGDGISGPCIAQYQAAAATSPDGPAVSAPAAELSRFVATMASNPTTPIGLADNIHQCANQAHCDVCGQL